VIFDVVTSDFKGIRGVVDHDRALGDDDMKVKLSAEGKIKDISKQLRDFDKGYIGMTLIAKDHISVYKDAFNKVLKEKGEGANIEAVLQMLSDTGKAGGVVDVSNYKWLEIDNQDELKVAEEALNKYPDVFPYFS
jgi:choline kinase